VAGMVPCAPRIAATIAALVHVVAAVDVEDLAGDETAGLARQEQAGRRQLVDTAEPLQRNLALDLLARLMDVLRPIALGIDGAGCDGVDGDAFSSELTAERLGETVQTGFSRDVVRAVRHLPPETIE